MGGEGRWTNCISLRLGAREDQAPLLVFFSLFGGYHFGLQPADARSREDDTVRKWGGLDHKPGVGATSRLQSKSLKVQELMDETGMTFGQASKKLREEDEEYKQGRKEQAKKEAEAKQMAEQREAEERAAKKKGKKERQKQRKQEEKEKAQVGPSWEMEGGRQGVEEEVEKQAARLGQVKIANPRL